MMFSTIKFLAAIALLFAGALAQSDTTPVTGQLGNATVVANNPGGVAYVATFSASSKSNIAGSVLALTSSDNHGVNFQVALSGLPTHGGPFLYHVHDNPISADGNCTSAGAHVDPFLRGEDPVCDSSLPQTCQVGDLSGKWGKPTTQMFSANYIDRYVSTIPGTGAFVGNRSIVVHFANKTRIACANFTSYTNATTAANGTTVVSNGSSTDSGSSTASTTSGSGGSSGSASSSSSTASASTGAAAQRLADTGLIVLLGGLALLV